PPVGERVVEPPPVLAEGVESAHRAGARLDRLDVDGEDLVRVLPLAGRHLRVLLLDERPELRHRYDPSSASTVMSSGRRGGRTSRHVHCCGSLSGRKRRKRVPWRKRLCSSLSYRTSQTSSGRTGFHSSSLPRDHRLWPPGTRESLM